MSNRQDQLVVWLKSLKNEMEGKSRGKVSPQFIIGVIVVIIIAPALVAAAVDIQSSLSGTPAFTWFSAAVVAILIVAAIVAAVLGL